MGKLDEAVENGCIESLLDYGHSFTPTYSPISLPTTTSGPSKFFMLVNERILVLPQSSHCDMFVCSFVCDSY